MTQTVDKSSEKKFIERLQNGTANRGPDWVKEIRRRGVARFEEMGLPNRKQEVWRFTNVEPIIQTPFHQRTRHGDHGLAQKQIQSFLFGAGACAELVFVNGLYAPELSNLLDLPLGVDATSLTRGVSDYSRVVKSHLDKYLEHADVFAAVNSACLHDGAYIHIRQGVQVERPIHIIFVSTNDEENLAVCSRNLVVVEKNSQATVIESYVSLANGTRYLNNVVTEAVVKENAQLSLCKIVEEGLSGNHMGTTQVSQGANSTFHSHAITLNGKIVRNALNVAFNGEGSECVLNGLYLNGDDRLIDNALTVDHARPQCTSRIKYKGVLDGHSRSVFTGGVLVREHARKTDSNQINSNILLSDQAQINTKPQLKIFNDDVKCTHGATIGPPPRDMLFYFQSRAIDEITAIGMLTCGFARDVTKDITIAALRERIDRAIIRAYGPAHGVAGKR